MENTNNPINLQKNEPENKPETEGVLDEYVSGYQQLELEGYHANIRKARNWLLAAAGIFLVSIFIQMGDYMDLLPAKYKILFFGFPGLLVALAIAVPKKPVLCLSAALVAFVGFYVYMVIDTGEAAWLYNGIIIKIFLIAALLKGLADAKEAETLKREYDRGSQS